MLDNILGSRSLYLMPKEDLHKAEERWRNRPLFKRQRRRRFVWLLLLLLLLAAAVLFLMPELLQRLLVLPVG